jgi:hypothetical protein
VIVSRNGNSQTPCPTIRRIPCTVARPKTFSPLDIGIISVARRTRPERDQRDPGDVVKQAVFARVGLTRRGGAGPSVSLPGAGRGLRGESERGRVAVAISFGRCFQKTTEKAARYEWLRTAVN